MKLRLRESPDFGLLVLRVGIGLMFVLVHGLPKVMGGVSMWAGLGGAFNQLLGIAFIPAFWGFLATVSEFGGGMCLMAGVLFRPACGCMLFTLVIAVASIIRGGYGFNSASQPVELGLVLLALFSPDPADSLFRICLLQLEHRDNYAHPPV
jgi:putative oxidoreductase